MTTIFYMNHQVSTEQMLGTLTVYYCVITIIVVLLGKGVPLISNLFTARHIVRQCAICRFVATQSRKRIQQVCS